MKTLLIKESGTYSISGRSLNVTPKTSVIEAWTKKNGADNWNKLKTSQKRPLEKATYQFAIQNGNLILQAANETVRDGRFSNGNYYFRGHSLRSYCLDHFNERLSANACYTPRVNSLNSVSV